MTCASILLRSLENLPVYPDMMQRNMLILLSVFYYAKGSAYVPGIVKLSMERWAKNNNIHGGVFFFILCRFSGVFPSLNMAVKRREQALQDYKRLQSKVEKYEEKEKTGPILAKLHQVLSWQGRALMRCLPERI